MSDNQELRQSVVLKVKEVILSQFPSLTEEELTEATSLTEDLKADSLDALDLLLALEETFDLEIPDEAAESILTFKDAVDYIYERLSETSPASQPFPETTPSQAAPELQQDEDEDQGEDEGQVQEGQTDQDQEEELDQGQADEDQEEELDQGQADEDQGEDEGQEGVAQGEEGEDQVEGADEAAKQR